MPDFLMRAWSAGSWPSGSSRLAAFFPWELGVKADPFASAPAGSARSGISRMFQV